MSTKPGDFHFARRVRKWDVIEALLDFGADIDAFKGELYGHTILRSTAGFGDFEHAYWLMERGADPTYEIKLAPDPERVGAMPVLEGIFIALSIQRRIQRQAPGNRNVRR